MKRKIAQADVSDDLQPEYDFDALGPLVRGKYAARLATASPDVLLTSDSGQRRGESNAGCAINVLM